MWMPSLPPSTPSEVAVPFREEYCTLFDSNFLPQGLALYRSLERWAGPFRLWILCMDTAVERQLAALGLPHAVLIPLRDIETPELLAVKPGRTRGEYCWTLTPFLFPAVFSRDPAIGRATYLDADLLFFGPPGLLLGELDSAGKDVLITDHAYDPEYDQSALSGRFCVQFLTIRNNDAGLSVQHWWSQRCLEWCHNRYEDGKFGDQKYLDEWPARFGDSVHILSRTGLTLAPWNVKGLDRPGSTPVLYHFHSFRIVAPGLARLYEGYRVPAPGMRFYDAYLESLREASAELMKAGIAMACLPEPPRPFMSLRRMKRNLTGAAKYVKLGFSGPNP
jgi:hypothetical protein